LLPLDLELDSPRSQLSRCIKLYNPKVTERVFGSMVRSARFLYGAHKPTTESTTARLQLDRHAPVVLAGHDFEVRRASPVPSSLPRPLDMPPLNSTRGPPAPLFLNRDLFPLLFSTASSSTADHHLSALLCPNATGKDSCCRLTRGGEHSSRNLRAVPLRRACCNRLEHGPTHRHLSSHRPPPSTATV
jgi:hypothetical protein